MSGFDGVVLCGGASRRMGRDKALLEVDGTAMASRVAAALVAAGATTVATVGGDGDALEGLGIDHVPDRWPGEGPLGGVITALEDVGAQPLVAVLACDLLRPDGPTVVALADRLASGGADAVVPCVDGRAQWMHAVWRRRVAGVLGAVFSSGERSLFGAVGGLDLEFVDAVAADPFVDADVPGELSGGPSGV